jgi:hypothetical protein
MKSGENVIWMGMKSAAQFSITSISFHDILPMSTGLITGYRLILSAKLDNKWLVSKDSGC